MVNTSLYLKFSANDNYNQKFGGNSDDICNDPEDCGLDFECVNGYCKCVTSENNESCRPYPGKGENCTLYCNSIDLICSPDTKICEPRDIFLPPSDAFITASQVALSAALVMGIAALAMVIYRLCTKPKYLNARQRAHAARLSNPNPSNFDENDAYRSSLSSIQIRVLTQMRDRPPAYTGGSPRFNHLAVNSPVAREAQTDSPPPYIAGAPQDLTHQPPPYNEIILCPNGYINQSYTESAESRSVPPINSNEIASNMESRKIITMKV